MASSSSDSGGKRMLVVGGGLVGALQALYLAKRGFQVQVLERREDSRRTEFTEGRSINLALSDRGKRALQEAGDGVLEQVEALGVPMFERQTHSVSGALGGHAYGKEGQHILSVPRRALNEILLTAAEKYKNVNLVFGARVGRVDIDKGVVEYSVGPQDAPTQEAVADVVFGCDGAFSAIRKAFLRKQHFDYQQEYLSHGYKELTIPPLDQIPGQKSLPGAIDGYAMKPNCLHIWPRHQFMMIALPNKDKSFTVTMFLPFRGERNSFDCLKTQEDVQEFFEREFPDVIPLLPNLHQEFQTNPTSSLLTVRCSPHTYGEHACLLGDAAHAIVPFYGQGCNAGFEDVRVLFDLLEEHRGDWSHTLEVYGRTRPKDSYAIADLALYNFIEMRDHTASTMFLAKKKLEHLLMKVVPESSYLPLYSLVSFSHVPYSQAWADGMRRDRCAVVLSPPSPPF